MTVILGARRLVKVGYDQHTKGWNDALDAVGKLLPEISHDDICRLSRSFNENARLDTPQDYRINEWLKTRIAASQ